MRKSTANTVVRCGQLAALACLATSTMCAGTYASDHHAHQHVGFDEEQYGIAARRMTADSTGPATRNSTEMKETLDELAKHKVGRACLERQTINRTYLVSFLPPLDLRTHIGGLYHRHLSRPGWNISVTN